jgi:hypothetical protein
MKCSGMRWDIAGGQGVLTARSLIQSERFDEGWNLQLLVQPHEQLPPCANKRTVEVNFPNYKKRLIPVVDLLTLICTH